MNLKEQTVYIPIGINGTKVFVKKGDKLLTVSDNGGDDFEVVNKEQKICISKDELIELLGNMHDEVWELTSDGWNGEIQSLKYISGIELIEYQKQKQQFINNILNQ
jgi:hypothetical protein